MDLGVYSGRPEYLKVIMGKLNYKVVRKGFKPRQASEGQGLVEYSLLLALVAVVAIVGRGAGTAFPSGRILPVGAAAADRAGRIVVVIALVGQRIAGEHGGHYQRG